MQITKRETAYAKTIELITLRLSDGRELTVCRTQESDPDFNIYDDDLEPQAGASNTEIYDSLDDDTRERIDELVRADPKRLTMKTYKVPLWSDIIVDAENEEAAFHEAHRQLNAGDDDNVVMDFLDRLQVEEDGVDEVANTRCMYDHDHAKGGCEFHD